MAKLSLKNANGTSFHGVTIETTVKKLKEVLGEPEHNSGDKKCNYTWNCETENGDVFTIYDFKFYRPLEETELIDFNIGSFSKRVDITAKVELLMKF